MPSMALKLLCRAIAGISSRSVSLAARAPKDDLLQC